MTTSNFVLFSCFLSRASLMQVTSTVWSATHSLPEGERTTIPHFNQDTQDVHITTKIL